MKLEIENVGVWHLNISIWAFKCRRLMFMKSTPGPGLFLQKKIFFVESGTSVTSSEQCTNLFNPSLLLNRPWWPSGQRGSLAIFKDSHPALTQCSEFMQFGCARSHLFRYGSFVGVRTKRRKLPKVLKVEYLKNDLRPTI